MKILQINLNRSQSATDLAFKIAAERKADVILSSEPNKSRSAGWIMNHEKYLATTTVGTIKVRNTGLGKGFAWIEIDSHIQLLYITELLDTGI